MFARSPQPVVTAGDSYLTDGVSLFRIVVAFDGDTTNGRFVALEDCRSLDVELVSTDFLQHSALRPVDRSLRCG